MNVLNKISNTLNKQMSMKNQSATAGAQGTIALETVPADGSALTRQQSGRLQQRKRSTSEITQTNRNAVINELASRVSPKGDARLIEELCALALHPQHIATTPIDVVYSAIALKEWSLQHKQQQQQQKQPQPQQQRQNQRHTIASLQRSQKPLVQNETQLHDQQQLQQMQQPLDQFHQQQQHSPQRAMISLLSDQVSPADLLQLAQAHLHYWIRRGVTADNYHLQRARVLFEAHIKQSQTRFLTSRDKTPPSSYALGAYASSSAITTATTASAATAATGQAQQQSSGDARMKVDYCKVLMFLGDVDAAADVIRTVVAQYESTDPRSADFLFYAGAIFKAKGEYEKANNFFFDANQSGPPLYFSQIEMMTIISRNLEELNASSGADAESDALEDENEDAYRMVHAHLILEGLLEERVEYEDWISDAATWLQLGDKCALHHMFSLATDFYGLGIMRDPDAFRKPMLWYKFAKACHKCGRSSDAQLAVKQALSRAPFNAQLRRAYRCWHQEAAVDEEALPFRSLVALGSIDQILQLLPQQQSEQQQPGLRQLVKLQAIVRGAMERSNQRVAGLSRRSGSTRRMYARTAVLLCSSSNNSNSSNNYHSGSGSSGLPNQQQLPQYQLQPLLLSVRPSWLGVVSHIDVFDVRSCRSARIKLRSPFAPALETGAPRRLALSVECKKIPRNNNNNSSNAVAAVAAAALWQSAATDEAATASAAGQRPLTAKKRAHRASVNTFKKQRRRLLLRGVSGGDGGEETAQEEEDGVGLEDDDDDTDEQGDDDAAVDGVDDADEDNMFDTATAATATDNEQQQRYDVQLILKFTDLDSGHYVYRKMRLFLPNAAATSTELQLQLQHSSIIEESPPTAIAGTGAAGVYAGGTSLVQLEDFSLLEHQQEQQHQLQLQQLQQQFTSPRSMRSLRSNSSRSQALLLGVEEIAAATAAAAAGSGAPSSAASAAAGAEDDNSSSNSSALGTVGGGFSVLSLTNSRTVDVLKRGICWRGRCFLARVVNDCDVTQARFFDVQSNNSFVFLMTRESIHRGITQLRRRLEMLLQLLALNPLVAPLLDGDFPLTAEEAVQHSNPMFLNGLHCFTEVQADGLCATVILVDPNNQPILGSGFEVLELSSDSQQQQQQGDDPTEFGEITDAGDSLYELEQDGAAAERIPGSLLVDALDAGDLLQLRTGGTLDEDSSSLAHSKGPTAVAITAAVDATDVAAGSSGSGDLMTGCATTGDLLLAFGEVLDAIDRVSGEQSLAATAAALADVQDAATATAADAAAVAVTEQEQRVVQLLADNMWSSIEWELVQVVHDALQEEQQQQSAKRAMEDMTTAAVDETTQLVSESLLQSATAAEAATVAATAAAAELASSRRESIRQRAAYLVLDWMRNLHGIVVQKSVLLQRYQQQLLQEVLAEQAEAVAAEALQQLRIGSRSAVELAESRRMRAEDVNCHARSGRDIKEMRRRSSLLQRQQLTAKLHALPLSLAAVQSDDEHSSGDDSSGSEEDGDELLSLSAQQQKVEYFVNKIRTLVEVSSSSSSGGVVHTAKPSLSALSSMSGKVVPSLLPRRDTFTPQLSQLLHQAATTTTGAATGSGDEGFTGTAGSKQRSSRCAKQQQQQQPQQQAAAIAIRAMTADGLVVFTDTVSAATATAGGGNIVTQQQQQQTVDVVRKSDSDAAAIAAAVQQMSRRRSVAAISHHNREVLNSRHAHNSNSNNINNGIRDSPAQTSVAFENSPLRSNDFYYSKSPLQELNTTASAAAGDRAALSSWSFASAADAEAAATAAPATAPAGKRVSSNTKRRKRQQEAAAAATAVIAPAQQLPSYAFESAEGLKRALRSGWDDRTVSKFFTDSIALSSAASTARATTAAARSTRSSSRKSTARSSKQQQSRATTATATDVAALSSRPRTAASELPQTEQQQQQQPNESDVAAPFSRISTRVSCRSPADFSQHFRSTHPAVIDASELFHAEQQHGSEELFKQSLQSFNRVGYMQQQQRPLAHATHWNRKLTAYLSSQLLPPSSSYPSSSSSASSQQQQQQQRQLSMDGLKKRITTLLHTAPQPLNFEEAICALADAEGSVGCAVDRLRNLEFVTELKLVCRSLNVRSMVLQLQGGADCDFYDTNNNTNTSSSNITSGNYYNSSCSSMHSSRPATSEDAATATSATAATVTASGEAAGESLFDGASFFVSNPFGGSYHESHPEVVKHVQLRKQYETSLRDSKQKRPKSSTSTVTAVDYNSISGISLQQQQHQQQLKAALLSPRSSVGVQLPAHNRKVLTSRGKDVSALLSDPAAAAHDIATAGVFQSAARQQLSQASPYVLGRSSVISLERTGSTRNAAAIAAATVMTSYDASYDATATSATATSTGNEKRPRSASVQLSSGGGSSRALAVAPRMRNSISIHSTLSRTPLGQPLQQQSALDISAAISSAVAAVQDLENAIPLPLSQLSGLHAMQSASQLHDQRRSSANSPAVRKLQQQQQQQLAGDKVDGENGEEEGASPLRGQLLLRRSASSISDVYRQVSGRSPAPLNRAKSMELPLIQAPQQQTVAAATSTATATPTTAGAQPKSSLFSRGPSLRGLKNHAVSFVQPAESFEDNSSEQWRSESIDLLMPGNVPTRHEVMLQQRQLQERILAQQQQQQQMGDGTEEETGDIAGFPPTPTAAAAGSGSSATRVGDNMVSMNNWYAGNRPKQRALRETRKSQGTFRIAGRIEDIFEQAADAPVAVMSRRDAIKAGREELLLRSNKSYIRDPIVRKGMKIVNMTQQQQQQQPFDGSNTEQLQLSRQQSTVSDFAD